METKKIIRIINACANETDIWDNERWNKFMKLIKKRLKEDDNNNPI